MILLKKWKHKKQLKKWNKDNLISAPFLKNFKIQINGKGNSVIIDKDTTELKGKLYVWGDNNKIIIKKGYFCNIDVSIGIDKNRMTSNCTFLWDQNIYCGSANIVIGEDGSEVIIEKDSLISDGIDMYCTDGHSIMNLNHEILNIGHFIHIGKHVWIGKNVKIGKNTSIPSNSVVGWGSVVTKQFSKENIIIGGNPATIIKENILWEKDFPNLRIKKEKIQSFKRRI